MWKVLLVIAAFVLAGSAWLSYDNMNSHKEAKQSIVTDKATKTTREAALTKTTEELKQIEESIQMLATETETLQNTKIDLDAKLVEAEANQRALQSSLEAAVKSRDDAKKLAGDIQGVQAVQKEMAQLRTLNEEAEIEVTQLEGAVAAAQVDRDRLEKVAAELAALRTDQEAGVIRGEFQSTIAKAYNQWGFVIVNGGNDQGVVNRAQLDVYRRGMPICRLLVTSVEASQSAADIVPGSLAPGQSVQPGDTVVKSVRVETPAVVPASAPAGGAAAPAPADAGGAAPAADGMAPDPFGAPAPAPAAAPDPFGAPASAPAGGMAPDPFGAPAPAPAPAPAGDGMAPDPFGAPPAPGAAPAPAPGAAPATGTPPDPFAQ